MRVGSSFYRSEENVLKSVSGDGYLSLNKTKTQSFMESEFSQFYKRVSFLGYGIIF